MVTGPSPEAKQVSSFPDQFIPECNLIAWLGLSRAWNTDRSGQSGATPGY